MDRSENKLHVLSEGKSLLNGTIEKATHRLSLVSKGAIAPPDCKWLEVFYGKELIKRIPVPTKPLPISEEQINSLVAYSVQEHLKINKK